MARFTNRSFSVVLHIFQLMLFYNFSISGAVLTYDGCMSDSANSYKVGGWCFLFYTDPSWPPNTPTQNDAQYTCLPHGTLAVGVTSKMLNTFITRTPPATNPHAWTALERLNRSTPTNMDGWYWRALMPSGGFATFPTIKANFPWGTADPDNSNGNDTAAVLVNNYGYGDAPKAYPKSIYGNKQMAVICQFAPIQWKYLPRGHGRFANSAYQIAQTTVTKLACIIQCHRSVSCISLAFNPTTNDCQIYAVSPDDPQFTGSVTTDNSYDWYIRDEMKY
uniref:Apple domain-containing protein n=1 Tax=Plectus sambesii TaxID=2011161 RepID=A0A914XNH6_9BILA